MNRWIKGAKQAGQERIYFALPFLICLSNLDTHTVTPYIFSARMRREHKILKSEKWFNRDYLICKGLKSQVTPVAFLLART